MVSVINYKNKEILFLDHCKKSGEDLTDSLKEGDEAIKQFSLKGAVLLLADFRQTYISESSMDYIKSKESVKINKEVLKTAVVGVDGIKGIFLRAYSRVLNKHIKTFDNLEDAKEYLIS